MSDTTQQNNTDVSRSFMQTQMWAEFKKKHDWTTSSHFSFEVFERRLRRGLTFSYIPEATIPASETLSAFAAQAQAALSVSRKPTTVFGRIELLVPYSDKAHHALLRAGFVKPRDEVQPEHRQEIDLTQSLKDIKTAMKPKGRYNIGVAEKHGVVIEKDNSAKAIEAFSTLAKDTSARKKFHGRSGEYFAELIRLLDQEGMGGLWVATYEGKILAGAIIVFWQGRASYLYGASSSEHRNVMAPHLLHWHVIQEAKRLHCTVYDLIGVAPLDADAHHPWAGISRFKREFGGKTVHYLGSYDRVYRPVWYTLYQHLRK